MYDFYIDRPKKIDYNESGTRVKLQTHKETPGRGKTTVGIITSEVSRGDGKLAKQHIFIYLYIYKFIYIFIFIYVRKLITIHPVPGWNEEKGNSRSGKSTFGIITSR